MLRFRILLLQAPRRAFCYAPPHAREGGSEVAQQRRCLEASVSACADLRRQPAASEDWRSHGHFAHRFFWRTGCVRFLTRRLRARAPQDVRRGGYSALRPLSAAASARVASNFGFALRRLLQSFRDSAEGGLRRQSAPLRIRFRRGSRCEKQVAAAFCHFASRPFGSHGRASDS